MGKVNFDRMNLGLNIQQRVRLVKCYILAGMLYGCENWTIVFFWMLVLSGGACTVFLSLTGTNLKS